MKKKILFVISSLQSGGVSKSMINLLNVIDKEKYDIHLLLMSTKNAVFDVYIPNNVTVHTDSRIEALTSGVRGLKFLITHGHIVYFFLAVIRILLSPINKSFSGLFLSKILPTHDEKYDCIVDFNGQHQLYYMIDKLNSRKKITFFHSDYSKWSHYYYADKKYFPKTDKIFTISDICVKSLINFFPQQRDKIAKMENINDSLVINELSKSPCTIKSASLVLMTIGHVQFSKGIDIALDAAYGLQKNNIDFIWYFIGAIKDDEYIRKIQDSSLRDNFIFLGIQPNPYPYLKQADIYVHPSRLEGKSIALDEAKILCKPIVVTNFSTVRDQFEDRFNASICEMNGTSLGDSIIELASDRTLRENYIQNLQNNIPDNRSQLEILYKVFEN